MEESDAGDLPPGTDIHGAVIEERIKAGGQGTVYRARDTATGMLLAIKLIPFGPAETWAQREACVSPAFEHPNLARLVGLGTWPDAEPRYLWLKTVYVQGRELGVWAWEENPDARGVTATLVGLTRGLAVVHDQDVVHRDVKESNILVRASDGEPVLVDFGAARREGQTTITQGLFPPGTPLYRSPEAWSFGLKNARKRGAHYRPARTDDLYALGVVLYRVLTGLYPFNVTADDSRAIQAVIHREPLPPHIINPLIPEPLSDVCMKLLAKKPGARYPSALALHEALKELLAHADDSWKVPLRRNPHPPRRGPRGSVAKKPVARPAPPPLGLVSTSTPAMVVDLSVRAMVLQALRRAALGMGVLLGLGLAGWWLVEHASGSGSPTQSLTSPTLSPTLKRLMGQEVAPSWPPLEAGRTAAPPSVGLPSAVVASWVTRLEEDALKKKQQAPKPQGDKRRKSLLPPLASLCLGAAASTHVACQSAPPVRPISPQVQTCPEDAVENMRKLGLFNELPKLFRVGDPWDVMNRPVPVQEGVMTTIRLQERWGTLRGGTQFSGQLHFKGDRIHGLFTEARTANGDTFKVCMVLLDTSDPLGKNPGAQMDTRQGKDPVKAFPIARLKPVKRFE